MWLSFSPCEIISKNSLKRCLGWGPKETCKIPPTSACKKSTKLHRQALAWCAGTIGFPFHLELRLGPPATRLTMPQFPESARESAWKSAGKRRRDCWEQYRGRFLLGIGRKSRGTALFPAVPPAVCFYQHSSQGYIRIGEFLPPSSLMGFRVCRVQKVRPTASPSVNLRGGGWNLTP